MIDPSALIADVEGAEADIARLADLGIDFHEITATLQRDGVRAVTQSTEDLSEALEDAIESRGV